MREKKEEMANGKNRSRKIEQWKLLCNFENREKQLANQLIDQSDITPKVLISHIHTDTIRIHLRYMN